jgi:hypothetical protein
MWQCYTFNELHWRDTHSSGTPYLSVQALHLSLWQDGDTISRKLNIQTIAKQECHAWGMLLSLVSPIAQCATGGGTGNLCGRTSQTAIRQCGNHQEPFNCACAGQISCGAGVVWSSALLVSAIGCIHCPAFVVVIVTSCLRPPFSTQLRLHSPVSCSSGMQGYEGIAVTCTAQRCKDHARCAHAYIWASVLQGDTLMSVQQGSRSAHQQQHARLIG